MTDSLTNRRARLKADKAAEVAKFLAKKEEARLRQERILAEAGVAAAKQERLLLEEKRAAAKRETARLRQEAAFQKAAAERRVLAERAAVRERNKDRNSLFVTVCYERLPVETYEAMWSEVEARLGGKKL